MGTSHRADKRGIEMLRYPRRPVAAIPPKESLVYTDSCSQSSVSKSCPIASGPSLSVASGCLRFRDVHASSSSR